MSNWSEMNKSNQLERLSLSGINEINERKEKANWFGFVNGAQPKQPKAARQAKTNSNSFLFVKEMNGICCGGVGWVCFLVVGYRRLAAIMLRKKRKPAKPNNQPFNFFLFLIQFHQFKPALFSFLVVLFGLLYSLGGLRAQSAIRNKPNNTSSTL